MRIEKVEFSWFWNEWKLESEYLGYLRFIHIGPLMITVYYA